LARYPYRANPFGQPGKGLSFILMLILYGKLKEKMLPFPISLVIKNVPLCFLIISGAMYKPGSLIIV
jgi:hypothetical protein